MSELLLRQIRLSLLIYYLHKKPILSVFSIIVQDEIRLYRDEKIDGINTRICTVIQYSRVHVLKDPVAHDSTAYDDQSSEETREECEGGKGHKGCLAPANGCQLQTSYYVTM